MSFKLAFVLSSIFYLPITNDKNTIKMYESSEMINKLEPLVPYEVTDLQGEDLKRRIKLVHDTWDKISKSDR